MKQVGLIVILVLLLLACKEDKELRLGSISGHVNDQQDHVPIDQAKVLLLSVNELGTMHKIDSSVTIADGGFQFHNLPYAEYILIANKTETVKPDTLSVVLDVEVRSIDFELKPKIIVPGSAFFLPKGVTVISNRGTGGFNGSYIDSMKYNYVYSDKQRISVIERHLRTFHFYQGTVIIEKEINERLEFSYFKNAVELKVIDKVTNNSLLTRKRFKFNNSEFAYPDYCKVLEGKLDTDIDYGSYDSSVYVYSNYNFVKEIHLFKGNKFLGKQEFNTTENTVSPIFRGFQFTDTPATLNQFCGFSFQSSGYEYSTGKVDPLLFPIKMFKSSDLLVSTGGVEFGTFEYGLNSGRVETMGYSCFQFDGVVTKFKFEY